LTDSFDINVLSQLNNNRFRLLSGAININGGAMRLRPTLGISVMLWVKLDTTQGDQEIFMTTNPESLGNKHGQYHFQANAGSVRWFHRNAESQVCQ
jgi:hypothetical protein